MSPRRQPSVQFESKCATTTCTIKKTDPMVVMPRNPIMTVICVLRRCPAYDYQCSSQGSEGKFNLNTSVYTIP